MYSLINLIAYIVIDILREWREGYSIMRLIVIEIAIQVLDLTELI